MLICNCNALQVLLQVLGAVSLQRSTLYTVPKKKNVKIMAEWRDEEARKAIPEVSKVGTFQGKQTNETP